MTKHAHAALGGRAGQSTPPLENIPVQHAGLLSSRRAPRGLMAAWCRRTHLARLLCRHRQMCMADCTQFISVWSHSAGRHDHTRICTHTQRSAHSTRAVASPVKERARCCSCAWSWLFRAWTAAGPAPGCCWSPCGAAPGPAFALQQNWACVVAYTSVHAHACLTLQTGIPSCLYTLLFVNIIGGPPKL